LGKGGNVKSTLSKNALILVAIAMFIFCVAININFIEAFTISSLLQEIAYMSILAMGMTFVILTGGIDLSVGAVMALSTTIMALFLKNSPFDHAAPSIIVAMVIAFAVCIGIGVFNGFCVTVLKLPPMVATLAMTWVAKGIAEWISKGPPILIKLSEFKGFFNYKIGGWVPVTFIFAVALLLFLSNMLKNRRSGREFYAVGSNQYAAFISGTNTKGVLMKAYIINALFAGISGVLVAAFTGSGFAGLGTDYELYTIAAVVMGGVAMTGGEGKMYLAFFGVVILRLLNKVVIYSGLSSVSGFIEGIIIGGILIVVLFINSSRKGDTKA
jgi:ribose transport system permease protein